MDLLLVNHRDPRHPQAGGAEQVLLEVGKRLAKHMSVTWLAESVPGLPGEEEIDGILVKRRGNRGSLHLHSLMEAKRHEVVIDSVAHAVPFFSYKVNKRTIALIHHVHQGVLDLEAGKLSPILKWLERRVKGYNNFIAVSNTTKRDLIKLGVKAEIRVIYNGVDHQKYKPGPKGEPTVLWIGRLKRYKNPLDVYEIARDLDFEFLLAGGGGLESEIRRLNEPNVKFLGRVSEDEKVRLYQRSWVLISTSFIEGWGMTIVEANSCGTPVVAYATGSVPEIVKEGINGYLVRYKDVKAMREAIVRTISQGERLFKSSYSESLNYNWDRSAEEYRSYVEALARR
ncbi:MAG: glycosyltransferase family 4 protein [Metallosphaera sp.]